MPAWVGTQPVCSYDEVNEAVEVRIGAETFNWTLADLATLASGLNAIDTMKANTAISLKLDGINIADPVEVVNYLNQGMFKYFR